MFSFVILITDCSTERCEKSDICRYFPQKNVSNCSVKGINSVFWCRKLGMCYCFQQIYWRKTPPSHDRILLLTLRAFIVFGIEIIIFYNCIVENTIVLCTSLPTTVEARKMGKTHARVSREGRLRRRKRNCFAAGFTDQTLEAYPWRTQY